MNPSTAASSDRDGGAAAGGRPAPIAPVDVVAWTVTSAAGAGREALRAVLAGNHRALAPNRWRGVRGGDPMPCWVGAVDGLDAAEAALPAALARYDCRATRLAIGALASDGFADAVAAVRSEVGPARVGLVLGTSASTIGATEAAYARLDADGRLPADARDPERNTPHAIAACVQRALALGGPCVTVSSACASSAKAFAQAERWLRVGWVDAVVVAGVEALSDSLLYGFAALGLVDAGPCRPFDVTRAGISLGEAAGYALLRRADDGRSRLSGPRLQLWGHGESNDAHHMSAPHPQGAGAARALDDALARAGRGADAVDYVNLHGTGTPQNDAVEAALLARAYPPGVHASATKGATGHTMGAAGIVEAAVCLESLTTGLRAGSAGCSRPEPVAGAALRTEVATAPTRCAVSHSFGFGGSNAVLVFGRAD